MPNQIVVKAVIVKVKGSWKKVYKTAPSSCTSWNSINRKINDIFDQSIRDYAILHKPFAPVLV